MTEQEKYRRWTAAAQEKALNRLREVTNDRWRPFYCKQPDCAGLPHGEWKWNHARTDQRPPTDDGWLTWLLCSGRGAGKTRAGSEWVHRMVEKHPRGGLIAATGADARDTLLEGESGILTIAPPGKRPHYEPSKRRLTWPNGAVCTVFSAEEPDRLRGPEHYFAWCDEAAFYPLLDDVWNNLMFGLRLGARPRVCVTTTPKPRAWLKELMAAESTRLSRASTYDNMANLSPVFAERIIKQYEGTRLGRQELHAELLTDVEGALWSWELVEAARVSDPPTDFDRVVVAVDPAGTAKDTSDETGILVVAMKGDLFYVLDDRSGRYTPHGWAVTVKNAVEDYSADAVVAETNFGGDMVTSTLRSSNIDARIVLVSARRSKSLRAEPVLGLYEQGRVKHVRPFTTLESQQTEWVPFDRNSKSPDRLDALVYGVTHLLRGGGPVAVASPVRRLRAVEGTGT